MNYVKGVDGDRHKYIARETMGCSSLVRKKQPEWIDVDSTVIHIEATAHVLSVLVFGR